MNKNMKNAIVLLLWVIGLGIMIYAMKVNNISQTDSILGAILYCVMTNSILKIMMPYEKKV